MALQGAGMRFSNGSEGRVILVLSMQWLFSFIWKGERGNGILISRLISVLVRIGYR